MRLLVITAAYPSPTEPERARFIEDLHLELIEQSNGALELVVIAPRVHDGDPLEEHRGGVRVLRFSYPSGGERLKESRPSPWRLAKYFGSGVRTTRRALRELPIDGVLAHWILPAGAVALGADPLGRIPLVVWAHGSDLHRYGARWPWTWIAAKAARRARAVFAVSRELAGIATGLLGVPTERVHVLPMGVAREFVPEPRKEPSGDGLVTRPGSDSTNSTAAVATPHGEFELEIVYVGDVTIEKGVGDLLAALEILWSRGRRVRLRILGDGPLRGYRSAGPEIPRGALVWEGAVSRANVAAALRAADVYVHASWAEGTPLAVLEALACACPVVATAVGGIPELVTEDVEGWLVPPRDPSAFADAIERLILEPDRVALARARLLAEPVEVSMASRVAICGPALAEIFGASDEHVGVV
jgi:glycosyltransferase involved in cell wall biosynthesis